MPPQADARVSESHGQAWRPRRAQATARQGTQTPDGLTRASTGDERLAQVRLTADMAEQSFRPAQRLRRRAEFQRAYEQGVRLRGRLMTVFVVPNQGAMSRLGVSATRKLGGAVCRNRAKRLVREVFRRHRPRNGWDIVVVPQARMLTARFADVEADYCSILGHRLG